ncbi:methyltransferase [Nonomuraea sp. H19]|uniref:class I SAM-dependent methyltransferase n=1 Tax=Nonomuraea sp. H19 TaxID=3452206 RepID=UPI003F89127A
MSFVASLVNSLRKAGGGPVVLDGEGETSGEALLRSSCRLARLLRSRGAGPGVTVVWSGGESPGILHARIAALLLGGGFRTGIAGGGEVPVDAAAFAQADNEAADPAGLPGPDGHADAALGERLAAWQRALGDVPERHSVLCPLGGLGDEAALATLLAGGTVVYADPAAHPARILAALERTRSTHVSLPSSLLWKLVQEPSAAMTDLSALRRVVHVGPEPRQDLVDTAIALLGPILAHVEEGQPDGAHGVTAEELVRVARAAAEARTGEFAADEVRSFVTLLDEAVLASMVCSLQRHGVLRDPERRHPVAEILSAARVAPEHHGLIARWLQVLAERGRLARDGDGYLGIAPVEERAVGRAWDLARQAWTARLGSAEFIDYLRHNAQRLPELMTGELRAVLLLFPEGRTDIADAVYRDTVTARYLNAAVGAAVHALAQARRDVPLRVLEVGAGTGATTDAVVQALGGAAPVPVDYLFTDVSNFFLTAARPRLAACPWMRFGLFDIDRDPAEQGFSGDSYDVVIAAGVLNNARDTDATIRALMGLLVSGGWLLITEPTREHLEILASQAFMMTPAEDARLASGATFLSLRQWLDVLDGAGAERVAVLPGEDHPLAPLGQRLFVARA